MAYGAPTGRTWTISKSGNVNRTIEHPFLFSSELFCSAGWVDGWQDPTAILSMFSLRLNTRRGFNAPNSAKYNYTIGTPSGTTSSGELFLANWNDVVSGTCRLSYAVVYSVAEYSASYIVGNDELKQKAIGLGYSNPLFMFGNDHREIFYIMLAGSWSFTYTIEWPTGSVSNTVVGSAGTDKQVGYGESYLSTATTSSADSLVPNGSTRLLTTSLQSTSELPIYFPTYSESVVKTFGTATRTSSPSAMTMFDEEKVYPSANSSGRISLESSPIRNVEAVVSPKFITGENYQPQSALLSNLHSFNIVDDIVAGTSKQRDTNNLSHIIQVYGQFNSRSKGQSFPDKDISSNYSTNSGLRIFLEPSTLFGAQEDPNDVYVFWKGNNRKYFDLDFNDELLDHCTSLSLWGTASIGTNISQSGSVIRMVSPEGGTGKIQKTYTNNQFAGLFRYAKVRVRSVGSNNQTITVSFLDALDNEKRYTITSDLSNVWSEIEIDLCRPDNTPTIPYSDGDVSTQFQLLNGVNSYRKIRFEAAAGVTIEIDYIELVAHEVKVSFLPSAKHDGFGNYDVVFWNIDGKTQTIAASDFNEHGLPTTLNGLPGPVLTNIANLDDRFSINDVLGPTNEFPYDIPISGLTTIQQRKFIYQLELHPNWGNYYGDGSLGNNIYVEAHKKLGSTVHGILFDDRGIISGEIIQVEKTTPPAGRGQGISNSRGYYTTSAAARDTEEIKVKHSSIESSPFNTFARARTTRSFVVRPAEGSLPDNLNHTFGYYVRICEEENELVFKTATNPTSEFTNTYVIDSSGNATHAVIGFDSGHQQFICIYNKNDDIKAKISDDFGVSWSNETMIAADSFFPELWTASSGLQVIGYFKYNSGTSGPGQIWTRYRQYGQTNWSTAQVMPALTFEPEKFGLTTMSDSTQAFVVVAKKEGENALTEFISYDFGVTWEETN